MAASKSLFHGPEFDALQARLRTARAAVDETRAAYQSGRRELRQARPVLDAVAQRAARQHVLVLRVAWEDAKRDHRAAQAALHLYLREHMARQ